MTEKTPALVAVPFGVVTEICPLNAVFGTTATIFALSWTANLAFTPLNLTTVVPERFEPVIVTVVPTAPLTGAKLLIVGVVTVKLPLLVAVPEGVVTVILPVVAPIGTVAVSLMVLGTTKLAETPLNCTDVTPVKRAPLMVTDIPAGPLVGKKLLIVGGVALVTSKVPLLVAVPFDVVRTEILPSVAFVGTVAVIWLGLTTLKVALTPLNLTELTFAKLEPLMITNVPRGPLVGEKPLMVGAVPLVTSKLPLLVAVPKGVPTEILPSAAPAGTVVVSLTDRVHAEDGCGDVELHRRRSREARAGDATDVPGAPPVGLKPLIVGAAPVTMKICRAAPGHPRGRDRDPTRRRPRRHRGRDQGV